MTDFAGHQTMLRRVKLLELDDSGTLQKMRLSGLKGEELADVPRVQPFGLSTNPPVGSEGVLLALGGRSDRGMVLGVESPSHRPTAREPGSTVIYDAFGNVASLVQAEQRYRHSAKIVLEVGGITVTITPAGVDIAGGGFLKHNGKDVGATHVHSAVQSGPSNTGQPI